ncbi:MAG: transposase [Heteroscytonema crispum UTEX LB 1556]
MTPYYPSNLTNEQWEILSELIPSGKKGGRKRSVDMQAIALRNPIHFVCGRGGECFPRIFALWKTVYHYFRKWRR